MRFLLKLALNLLVVSYSIWWFSKYINSIISLSAIIVLLLTALLLVCIQELFETKAILEELDKRDEIIKQWDDTITILQETEHKYNQLVDQYNSLLRKDTSR